jgi:hypothetical protein
LSCQMMKGKLSIEIRIHRRTSHSHLVVLTNSGCSNGRCETCAKICAKLDSAFVTINTGRGVLVSRKTPDGPPSN